MTKEDRLICIKIKRTDGPDIYDRIPRKEAEEMIANDPKHVTFTSKSAHKKYVLDQIKEEEALRRLKLKRKTHIKKVKRMKRRKRS